LVARGVLIQLQRPLVISEHEVCVGASIGIGIGPESGKRAEDLTDAADRAMYAAKRAGRGTVRIFEPQRRREEAEMPAFARAA
jgi:predicted signal transduction protein with EAL and GGDEF domain